MKLDSIINTGKQLAADLRHNLESRWEAYRQEDTSCTDSSSSEGASSAAGTSPSKVNPSAINTFSAGEDISPSSKTGCSSPSVSDKSNYDSASASEKSDYASDSASEKSDYASDSASEKSETLKTANIPEDSTKADEQKTERMEKPERKASAFSRLFSAADRSDREAYRQRFIRSNVYFTIFVYCLMLLVAAALIFKLIIDWSSTKALLGTVLSMLSPFLLGILIAYVLNPIVRSLQKPLVKMEKRLHHEFSHNTNRIVSILITYLLMFGFIIMVLVYVIPTLTNSILDFANYIPTAYNSFMGWVDTLQERFPNTDIRSLVQPLTDAIPNMVTTLQNTAANIVPALYAISMSIASWLVNLLLALILSIYILYDKKILMHIGWRIIYAFMPPKHITSTREILSECNRLFSNFVVGKFVDSSIIGALCFILMNILNLEYALLISIIVGITNMIPYFGPFIGAVPGTLILLFMRPLHALIFVVMILVLQQFDGLILGPRILGNSTGMKPLWIILAITIGGSVAGVIGMFLGVPVMAILSYLFNSYLQHRLDKRQISEEEIEEALAGMPFNEDE